MWAETHNHAVFTWFPQKIITNETCLTATTAEIEHCPANHDQNLFTPSMTNNFFKRFRTESDRARWRWHPKALRKQAIHTGGSRALKPHKLKIRLNLFRTEKQRIQCSFKQGFMQTCWLETLFLVLVITKLQMRKDWLNSREELNPYLNTIVKSVIVKI